MNGDGSHGPMKKLLRKQLEKARREASGDKSTLRRLLPMVLKQYRPGVRAFGPTGSGFACQFDIVVDQDVVVNHGNASVLDLAGAVTGTFPPGTVECNIVGLPLAGLAAVTATALNHF